MKTAVRSFKLVHHDRFDLSAEFNVTIRDAEKKYKDFINKKFKNQTKKSFHEVVEPKRTNKVQRGQLYITASFSDKINIAIAESDITTSLSYTVFNIKTDEISENYLLWYFNHAQIINYLQCFLTGNVISHLSVSVFDKLEIPLPKKGNSLGKISSIEVETKLNPFRILLNQYYTQYLFNFEKGYLLTAAILAGSISETLLYTYLIEEGINEKILKDRMLGNFIDFAEIYLLGQADISFPINHYREVQQLRNRTVHPVSAKGNIENEKEIDISSFDCFNHIVRYFGL